jgi:hypothetical protein
MNTNILVYILISIFALGLIILPFYLKRKGVIKETDIAKMLPKIIVGSGLFFELVNSLDLTQEPQIKKISKVIDETLKYIEVNITNGVTDEQVLDYVDAMCTQFNVALDEQKLNIVKRLLEVGVNEIKAKVIPTLTEN